MNLDGPLGASDVFGDAGGRRARLSEREDLAQSVRCLGKAFQARILQAEVVGNSD